MQKSKIKSTKENTKGLLTINPQEETKRIIKFIAEALNEQGFKKVVLAVSGGIDSTTSMYLLAKALDPKNIYIVHLPYTTSHFEKIAAEALKLGIPQENMLEISIREMVGVVAKELKSIDDKLRMGNLMARMRMIVVYDLAKKMRAMVCGTENKSEYYLGYFTRFGDEASDFEPIQHLYKTQVYEIAKYLGVAKKTIEQAPTAGLWVGQTDEEELGFSYNEADEVLCRYFDRGIPVEAIEKEGFLNAKKIIAWCKKQNYKHEVPFTLENECCGDCTCER